MKYNFYLFFSFIILSCHNDPVIDTSGSNFIITVIDPMGKKVSGASVYFYSTEKPFLDYDFNYIPYKTDIYGNLSIITIQLVTSEYLIIV